MTASSRLVMTCGVLAVMLGHLASSAATVSAQTPPALLAAVLPSTRAATVGSPVTAFVTVVNAGDSAVEGVGVFLRTPAPVRFTFQTTNPTTNAVTGLPNIAVRVSPGLAQTFAISLVPTAPFPPTLIEFDFMRAATGRVDAIAGVNTLLLSASETAVPDIVALAATASRDGILNATVTGAVATARATLKSGSRPPLTMRGAFSIAAINAGSAGADVTVEAASTGSPSTVLLINETDAATGTVIGGNRKRMPPGTTATFAVFASTPAFVPLDPANNRVVVEFRDSAGVVRGGTSVALSTVPGDRITRGADLFFNERFGGNGRTCGTCHPADNNFTLDPAFIARLAADDPLFVAETNPALADLENPRLMREFALILENVDGFDRPAVPRGVPHTLALATSTRSNGGPRLGWSGDGAPGDGTLRSFATGAVTQHFTKTLNRVTGIDFRPPTDDELVALEAFQLSLGRQRDLSLPLSLRGAKASSGQAIFLDGSVGRCNVCHVNAGATANLGAGSLGNEDFDTGVERFPPAPPRPADIPRPPDGGAGRVESAQGGFGNGQFNVPPLVEAASTPPFFHGNAVQTIEAAVAFYTSPEFSSSPGARDAGGSIDLSPSQIDEVAAFLRVINAIESLRQAEAMLAEAVLLSDELRERILELVAKALGDATRVLADGALHEDAVALLEEARAAAGDGLVDEAEAKLEAARALLIET